MKTAVFNIKQGTKQTYTMKVKGKTYVPAPEIIIENIPPATLAYPGVKCGGDLNHSMYEVNVTINNFNEDFHKVEFMSTNYVQTRWDRPKWDGFRHILYARDFTKKGDNSWTFNVFLNYNSSFCYPGIKGELPVFPSYLTVNILVNSIYTGKRIAINTFKINLVE